MGAPVAQSDHAVRACRASLDMLGTVPELNQRWASALSTEMDVAIGVNSGVAQVGNIGSRYKFKYGPLGHSVNVASRVQGLNKYFKTRLLVTGATFGQLSADFAGRRLLAVRVMNIDAPVDLYEVYAADDERSRTLCPVYEQALGQFESQQFHRAAASLGSLLPDCQNDGPTHVLLARTIDCILYPPHQFDAAWTAPGK